MRTTHMTSRYLSFIAGLYFLALGVVLIVRADLGTTPISSVNYVMSLHTPFTLGQCSCILNCVLILGQFWLVRGCGTRRDNIEILLQLPFSFVFGAFTDFNMLLTENLHPDGYIAAFALLLLGCLIQAMGVVLEVKPGVTAMSAEAFVKYTARRYNKNFGHCKVGFDFTLVLLAAILGLLCANRIEGIREGTLVGACLTGPVVNFLSHHVMTRRMLLRLVPVHH